MVYFKIDQELKSSARTIATQCADTHERRFLSTLLQDCFRSGSNLQTSFKAWLQNEKNACQVEYICRKQDNEKIRFFALLEECFDVGYFLKTAEYPAGYGSFCEEKVMNFLRDLSDIH